MADEYIDYWEVGEYGDHFVAQAAGLAGASKLVDVAQLRTEITTRVVKVRSELDKAGLSRSKKRGGAGDVDTAAGKARKAIDKFWNYLGSLDEDDVTFDLAAFFEGEKLGALTALKPADVKSKLAAVLRGFGVAKNKALPERAAWQKRLQSAHDDLAAALEGRGGAHTESVKATAGLITAREDFLLHYNGVAKNLVRGLLTSLGRKDEYELYFKDLQVNESGPRAPGDPEPPPAPPAPPQ